MDEEEINNTLKYCHGYIGTFASNELKLLKKPLLPGMCLIVNTAPRTSLGKHWVALYSGDDVILVFDSLCVMWRYSVEIREYVKKHFLKHYTVYCNAKRIQSIRSNTCGVFSVRFIEGLTKYKYVSDLSSLKRYKLFIGGRLATDNVYLNDLRACKLIKKYKTIKKFKCIA